MKHKKLFLLASLLSFWIAGVTAQNNAVTAGGDATGSGGSSSYSVGQVFYTAIEGSGGTINQGLQQPYEFFVLGQDNHPAIELEIGVYPNPTKGNPTLIVQNFESPLRIQLYDLHGRIIHRDVITQVETKIPMETLASAIYILRVSGENSLLKSFQIIKN